MQVFSAPESTDPHEAAGFLDFGRPKANDVWMGSMQVRKGKRWEREVANTFRAAGWAGARRGIGQARAADEVPDVDVPGLWIECKHGARTNPRGALAQAVEASGRTGRVPVAVTKDDGEEPIVTLRLADFLALVPPRSKTGP